VRLALLLAAGAALAASAFAAAEAACFALSRDRLEALKRRYPRGGGAADALRARPSLLLAVTWGGRVAFAGLAVGATLWALGPAPPVARGLALAAALAALAGLEVLGRGAGLRWSERVTLWLAPPLRALARLLWPLWWPLDLGIRAWVARGAREYPLLTDREIRALLAQAGEGPATIDEHERRLIERALALDRTRAYDVMTPRVDIFAWPADRTLAEIAPELRTVRFSRVPLYSENLDDIVGILYTRDAYQALISGQRDLPLRELAREPFFVPGSITLNRLLLDFQTRRIHLGIVIDEYGGTDGLVTLEDILEELVGEIADERELHEELIVRVGRNEILVDGSAELREINHFLNVSLPQLEHRTLNGYLLEELGRVPAAGEVLEREGVRIEVLEATETQVLRARVTRLGPRAEPAEGRPREDAGERAPRGTRVGLPGRDA
jgi:putative hemolysin